MNAKTVALTTACLLQASLVSGLWILLSLFTTTSGEFDGHRGNAAMVSLVCAGPVVAGWLLVVTFLAGIWSSRLRAHIARSWDMARLAVGFGSWFVLGGSLLLLLNAGSVGANPDGWTLMIGLAASSSLTIAGIVSRSESNQSVAKASKR